MFLFQRFPVRQIIYEHSSCILSAKTISVASRRHSTVSRADMPPKEKKPPAIPRPSSSVVLISPTNTVLLLHRVQTSSSFPSAHVFPGGNISPSHDGSVPDPGLPERHVDSTTYRIAAIRETFEESGILLARTTSGALLPLPDHVREEGRRAVHASKVKFQQWLEKHGGVADMDALIPFSRWITPPNVPKRYTTQMYIYLLPLSQATSDGMPGSEQEAVIPDPTPDGGKEHTAARFLPPAQWLDMATRGEIVLFPPQVYLLHRLAPYLTPTTDEAARREQRAQLERFIRQPEWSDMCISPRVLGGKREDGRVVLGLDHPGKDAEGRKGESEHVVLVDFKPGGPRRVEVRKRGEVLAEGRGKL